ncbi:MAG: PIN domain-containing protein [Caulobacteraceae bacterium]
MKIFIDTNIFLDFYRSAEGKVSILQNLKEFKNYIVFPEQVYNEFKRNRVMLLNNYIEGLKKNTVFPTIQAIPIIKEHEEYKEMQNVQKLFSERKKKLISFVEDMIKDPAKDIVLKEIEDLYGSSEITKIYNTDEIINKARKRQLLGNPPKAYKKTDNLSVGDEIIWEALLSSVDDDLVIASRDNTYKYNYDFLSMDFNRATGKRLVNITDTINEALNIIGKPVSPTLEKLEEEQIEEIKANPEEVFLFPIIIDNKSHGYAPLSMNNSFGQENIRFCYNCMAHTKFSGVRCTQCGAYNDD